jgi:hypothetical protein
MRVRVHRVYSFGCLPRTQLPTSVPDAESHGDEHSLCGLRLLTAISTSACVPQNTWVGGLGLATRVRRR